MKRLGAMLGCWLALITATGCGNDAPVAPAAKSEVELPKARKHKGNQGIYMDSIELPKEVLVAPKKK